MLLCTCLLLHFCLRCHAAEMVNSCFGFPCYNTPFHVCFRLRWVSFCCSALPKKKKRENRIPSFLPCLCKHTSLVHWQFSLFYWCAVAEPRFLNSAALLFPCFERKWLTYAQAHCHNLLLWVFLFLFAIITSVLAFFFFATLEVRFLRIACKAMELWNFMLVFDFLTFYTAWKESVW